MATIEVLRKSYNQIKDFPLFFFHKEEETDYEGHEYSYWIPEAIYVSKERTGKINGADIYSKSGWILLAYGSLIAEDNDNSSEYVKLELESFDSDNLKHVQAVLSLFLSKAHNYSDKYAARELIWMLNAYFINVNILIRAIKNFDKQTVQPYIWKTIDQISKCLSLPKQIILQKTFKEEGIDINIYYPNNLKEALFILYPSIDFTRENLNIFQLIDLVIDKDEYKNQHLRKSPEELKNSSNFFIQIREWLIYSNFLFLNYETLVNFFRLFSPDVQTKIVKRYFHAVRKAQTTFNPDLIKSFQINKYDNWGVYYHCSEEPISPINLTVPLLCDNILTFLNSDQSSLQTINGTLDLAYSQCDINSPEVDFGLKNFIPLCNGGAIPNQYRFPGFICYETIYQLKEDLFTQEKIQDFVLRLLTHWGSKAYKPLCHHEHITLQNCSERISKGSCANCDYAGKEWLDNWIIRLNNDKDLELIGLFLSQQFNLGSNIQLDPKDKLKPVDEIKTGIINLFDSRLKSISGKEIFDKNGSIIKFERGWSLQNNNSYPIDILTSHFLSPSWIIIEPRRNSYIGRGVLNNILGINKEILNHHNQTEEEIQRKEHEIIYPRIVEALKDVLDTIPDEKDKFFIRHDNNILRQLKADFYTRGEEVNSDQFSSHNFGFMTFAYSKYDKFCSPKYENDVNYVTQLPYMWCRGKECFKTSMGDQTLACCSSWERYTLLHIFEILGYPQVSQTNGGNEASELIRDFVGMVNKAASLFKRVKCRECNHILFPTGYNNFNRYNNFECRVPSCNERWKRVYLSQCHHCKSGLIDSRDSAQCPHGWHICPQCLSCCNDSIYESQANKYIIKRQQIPTKLAEKMGRGHNDKGEFFCPNCGGKIIKQLDPEREEMVILCNECGKSFPKAANWI